MQHAPERLSDLAPDVAVRIACLRCGFEEDWRADALLRHLDALGGSEVWAEVTRHLRCRSLGCGSTELRTFAVPPGSRTANMKRRIGRLDASLLGAALEVLEAAARRSRGRAAATPEVRLALLVVHRYARDRDCVRSFWTRASIGYRTADEGLAEPLRVIRQRLVGTGWLAPDVLLEETRTWPWDSPSPPGWRRPSDPCLPAVDDGSGRLD